MSTPYIDTASLENYYQASRQLEADNAALIAELREIIRSLLIAIELEGELLAVDPDLYARIQAVVEDV